jgi:hypothetical protein
MHSICAQRYDFQELFLANDDRQTPLKSAVAVQSARAFASCAPIADWPESLSW